MDREVWVRGGMIVSVLALVVLILATPSLLGRTTPELSTLPLLIIGLSQNESFFLVNVGGAFAAYRYAAIELTFNSTDSGINRTLQANDTYNFGTLIPMNATAVFTVDAYLIDRQQHYFEYNVTVRTERDSSDRTVLVFTFPYEPDYQGPPVRRTPPEDLRQPIPLRGTLP